MEKLNVLVVEDETWPRKRLIKLVEKNKNLKLAGIAATADQFEKELSVHPYDLILLDINLHGVNSIDILKKNRYTGDIIFITGNREHAIDAFDLEAADYLLKPVMEDRFTTALKKVFLRHQASSSNDSSPENRLDGEKIRQILLETYNLTQTEAYLCINIFRGKSRDEIIHEFSFSKETLKSHLKKIYKKTIERDLESHGEAHGKMQRLTAFLFDLSNKS